MDEYDIDCLGTEDEIIQHEARKARARYRDRGAFAGSSEASQIACWIEAVAPLVRTIVALVVALGAKTAREALARAKARTAPVDVEAEVGNLLGAMRGVPPSCAADVAGVVRPLVADRARLAREVEAAGVERDTAWEAHAAVAAELAKARAETKEVYAELETVRAKNISAVGALVEIRETLGRTQTERDAGRAEIARLAAAPGEARSAMICAMNGASLAHAALISAWSRYDQTPRCAAPGEAWERLRRAAVTACEEVPEWRAVTDLRAALAAVEPTVDITAITHDYRPGAQDGMPRLADVEAREVVPESLATHAEILGGDSRPTIATHEIRREGDSAIVAEQWTDGDKVVKRYEVRLNFSGLVHMALNTTAEERAAIDERADWRGVDDTNTAAPLRALTEAEARTWAAVALRPGGVRVIDVAAAILAASRGDVPPEVRPVCPGCWTGGDEPHARTERCSGARPEAPEMAVTTGEEQWTPKPGNRVRTVSELTAVGYGPGYRRLPGIAGVLTEEHSEGGWWVRHDDGTEAPYDTDELRPVTAAVPSIAGPAALDIASKAGGGR